MDESLKRRSSDHKMQSLVNSPWVKILSAVLQAIVAIGIAVVGAVSSGMLSKLGAIETQMAVLTTSRALTEDQLKQLQTFRAQIEARDITLRERLTTVEADVRNLKDRRP